MLFATHVAKNRKLNYSAKLAVRSFIWELRWFQPHQDMARSVQ